MTTCLVAFAVAFIVALGATRVVRSAATRLGVVDKPDNYRKTHQRTVPRLGGVAIYIAFAAPIVILYFFRHNLLSDALHQQSILIMALLAAGAMVLGIGIVDDVWDLRARWKLLLQIVPASVAIAAGYSIGKVSMPFSQSVTLGVFALPVTLFWFLGCMNAVNFLDGLDGLAAGVCLFATLTLLLVSVFFGNVGSILLMCCLSGAILGFLIFNFHPASIFLGDSGSMLLGFLVAALSLLGSRKAETTVALLVPFIALGLPIFDTTLTILRRWCRKLPISAADRQHIHHVLLAMGLSHKQVVLVLYFICIVLGAAALIITAGRSEVTIIVIGSLAITAFVCVRVFGGLRFAHLWGRFFEELARRQQSADAKVAVEKVVSYMRSATDTDSLWELFSTGADRLGLDHASLRMFGESETMQRVFTWDHDHAAEPNETPPQAENWGAQLHIHNNGLVLGELKLIKFIHDSPLPADTPELVDRLRREMGAQMERLHRTGRLARESPGPVGMQGG